MGIAASVHGRSGSAFAPRLVAEAERYGVEPSDPRRDDRGRTRPGSMFAEWPATGLISLALVCFAVSASAARQSSAAGQSQFQSQESSTPSDASGSAVEHRQERYRLQSEDVVTISFALSPEFDQTVTVQPDGYISLLGTEDLLARGLTIPGLIGSLQKAYGTVLNHPIISVTLKDFQTPFFVVSGQVTKPGQFALRYQTTVSEAIALAGGLTPAGKSHIFLLRRSSSGWFKVTPVNLSAIIAGKHVEDALLRPGDMVYVPEKFITKFRTYVPYSLGFYTSPQLVF